MFVFHPFYNNLGKAHLVLSHTLTSRGKKAWLRDVTGPKSLNELHDKVGSHSRICILVINFAR